MEDTEFRPGLFQHYKGQFYHALMLVCHHETRVKHVIYVPLYGGGEPAIRQLRKQGSDDPEDCWLDQVTLPNGNTVTRFTRVESAR